MEKKKKKTKVDVAMGKDTKTVDIGEVAREEEERLKAVKVTIGGEEAQMLVGAIDGHVQALGKIVTSLLKNKLTDAVHSVSKEIKRLQKMQGRVQNAINKES